MDAADGLSFAAFCCRGRNGSLGGSCCRGAWNEELN